MITVEEALQKLLEHKIELGTEIIPLEQGINRILRESWYADRDFPAYDRVTMDGIAIQFDPFEKGQQSFPIEGIAAAGSPQMTLQENSSCLEAMTGAILPNNTETIIRYEDLKIENRQATVLDEAIVKKGQNVHYQGEDRKRGDLIVPEGIRLSGPEIGVGATIGQAQIQVGKLPTVLVISTGDELVDIHETPLPYQIRRSNELRIRSTLNSYGIQTDTEHLNDNYDEIIEKISKFMDKYDVLILSGGVSAGKFDFLPKALEELGVEKVFHKIRQRPGKPFWFGKHNESGCTIFALPGNPVSSFLCLRRYFNHWLEHSLQAKPTAQPKARLASDVHFKADLTYFVQVKLSYDNDGHMLAYPVEGHGSGDLANLVDVDAFLELPRGKDVYKAGEVYGIFGWK